MGQAKEGNGLGEREALDPSRTNSRRAVSGCSNLKSSCGQTSVVTRVMTSECGL